MSDDRRDKRVIRVAIVDDSSFVRKALVRILSRDARLEVAGTAASGEELLDNLDAWRPDVITLDIAMPGMGGLATLDHIQERRPTPVVVLSTHTGQNAPLTIEALHRGALDFINKKSYSLVDFQALGAVLIDKLLQVAGVVVPEPQPPSRPARRDPRPTVASSDAEAPDDPRGGNRESAFGAILVGASTGGPLAIQRVLEDLGNDLPVPVVIIQHMPEGFTAHFAERLNAHLPLPVREATDREPLLAGTAYVAPAGRDLEVVERQDRLETRLRERSPDARHCPSIDRLFSSAADALGSKAVAAVLTGMGRDGAEGLAQLARQGAHTLAQDEATSVVYGMPRAAAELQAAREILPIEEIGPRARGLVHS